MVMASWMVEGGGEGVLRSFRALSSRVLGLLVEGSEEAGDDGDDDVGGLFSSLVMGMAFVREDSGSKRAERTAVSVALRPVAEAIWENERSMI